MSAKYTLRVRCASWESLESFYRDRIRPGALLGARVPFIPQRGDQVVVALELPDGLVVAIDSVVREIGDSVGGKTPILLRLVGFDQRVISRLETLVDDGRRARIKSAEARRVRMPPPAKRIRRMSATPPPPTPEDAPVDIPLAPFVPPSADALEGETATLYRDLTSELARMRELGAHQVLGIEPGADPFEVRSAYFALVSAFHPDVVSKYHAPAVTFAASELVIFINRAYDRVRSAVRARGAAAVAGPALRPELGWLIDMGDIVPPEGSAQRHAASSEFRVSLAPSGTGEEPQPRVPAPPLTADSLFNDLSSGEGTDPAAREIARGALEQAGGDDAIEDEENLSELVAEAASAAARGDLEEAAKLYARALRIDPRDRKLRARYHTTRGQQLLASGDRVRATTQLELALTHDADNREANEALATVRGSHERKRGLKGWFGR